jgi:hypothetical protein
MTPTSRNHHPLFGIKYGALDLLINQRVQLNRTIVYAATENGMAVLYSKLQMPTIVLPPYHGYTRIFCVKRPNAIKDISCKRPLNRLGLEFEYRPGE